MTCVHEFEHVHRDDWPSMIIPGRFRCVKCGFVVDVGGAVEHPRDAHDASYRPDLPLKSTEQNLAAWADSVRRAEDATR